MTRGTSKSPSDMQRKASLRHSHHQFVTASIQDQIVAGSLLVLTSSHTCKMKSSRFLRLLCLLLVFVTAAMANEAQQECANPGENGECIATETTQEEVIEEEIDPSCPSRPHIIRCAAHYLDTNHNNKLERSELEDAIAKLPWYSRGILKIIGSVNKIMQKCDADGDGAISIDHDMEQTKETCLATCFKRKAFKSAFFPECDK